MPYLRNKEGLEFDDPNIKRVEEMDFNRFRILSGVFEGPEISELIPFQANLDFTNSISLNKGLK